MNQPNEEKKGIWKYIPTGIPCLVIVIGLFCYIGAEMGVANMLNTIMKTGHDLLLNTVFYLMSICVITGAIGRLFVEFGVVKLLEKLLVYLYKRFKQIIDLFYNVILGFSKSLLKFFKKSHYSALNPFISS